MDYPKCKQPVRTAPWITYDKFTYQPGRHGFYITNTLTQTTKAMMTAIACVIMLLLQKMSNILEIAVVMTLNETFGCLGKHRSEDKTGTEGYWVPRTIDRDRRLFQ